MIVMTMITMMTVIKFDDVDDGDGDGDVEFSGCYR